MDPDELTARLEAVNKASEAGQSDDLTERLGRKRTTRDSNKTEARGKKKSQRATRATIPSAYQQEFLDLRFRLHEVTEQSVRPLSIDSTTDKLHVSSSFGYLASHVEYERSAKTPPPAGIDDWITSILPTAYSVFRRNASSLTAGIVDGSAVQNLTEWVSYFTPLLVTIQRARQLGRSTKKSVKRASSLLMTRAAVLMTRLLKNLIDIPSTDEDPGEEFIKKLAASAQRRGAEEKKIAEHAKTLLATLPDIERPPPLTEISIKIGPDLRFWENNDARLMQATVQILSDSIEIEDWYITDKSPSLMDRTIHVNRYPQTDSKLNTLSKHAGCLLFEEWTGSRTFHNIAGEPLPMQVTVTDRLRPVKMILDDMIQRIRTDTPFTENTFVHSAHSVYSYDWLTLINRHEALKFVETRKSVTVYIDKNVRCVRFRGLLLELFQKYPDTDTQGFIESAKGLWEEALPSSEEYLSPLVEWIKRMALVLDKLNDQVKKELSLTPWCRLVFFSFVSSYLFNTAPWGVSNGFQYVWTRDLVWPDGQKLIEHLEEAQSRVIEAGILGTSESDLQAQMDEMETNRIVQSAETTAMENLSGVQESEQMIDSISFSLEDENMDENMEESLMNNRPSRSEIVETQPADQPVPVVIVPQPAPPQEPVVSPPVPVVIVPPPAPPQEPVVSPPVPVVIVPPPAPPQEPVVSPPVIQQINNAQGIGIEELMSPDVRPQVASAVPLNNPQSEGPRIGVEELTSPDVLPQATSTGPIVSEPVNPSTESVQLNKSPAQVQNTGSFDRESAMFEETREDDENGTPLSEEAKKAVTEAVQRAEGFIEQTSNDLREIDRTEQLPDRLYPFMEQKKKAITSEMMSAMAVVKELRKHQYTAKGAEKTFIDKNIAILEGKLKTMTVINNIVTERYKEASRNMELIAEWGNIREVAASKQKDAYQLALSMTEKSSQQALEETLLVLDGAMEEINLERNKDVVKEADSRLGFLEIEKSFTTWIENLESVKIIVEGMLEKQTGSVNRFVGPSMEVDDAVMEQEPSEAQPKEKKDDAVPAGTAVPAVPAVPAEPAVPAAPRIEVTAADQNMIATATQALGGSSQADSVEALQKMLEQKLKTRFEMLDQRNPVKVKDFGVPVNGKGEIREPTITEVRYVQMLRESLESIPVDDRLNLTVIQTKMKFKIDQVSKDFDSPNMRLIIDVLFDILNETNNFVEGVLPHLRNVENYLAQKTYNPITRVVDMRDYIKLMEEIRSLSEELTRKTEREVNPLGYRKPYPKCLWLETAPPIDAVRFDPFEGMSSDTQERFLRTVTRNLDHQIDTMSTHVIRGDWRVRCLTVNRSFPKNTILCSFEVITYSWKEVEEEGFRNSPLHRMFVATDPGINLRTSERVGAAMIRHPSMDEVQSGLADGPPGNPLPSANPNCRALLVGPRLGKYYIFLVSGKPIAKDETLTVGFHQEYLNSKYYEGFMQDKQVFDSIGTEIQRLATNLDREFKSLQEVLENIMNIIFIWVDKDKTARQDEFPTPSPHHFSYLLFLKGEYLLDIEKSDAFLFDSVEPTEEQLKKAVIYPIWEKLVAFLGTFTGLNQFPTLDKDIFEAYESVKRSSNRMPRDWYTRFDQWKRLIFYFRDRTEYWMTRLNKIQTPTTGKRPAYVKPSRVQTPVAPAEGDGREFFAKSDHVTQKTLESLHISGTGRANQNQTMEDPFTSTDMEQEVEQTEIQPIELPKGTVPATPTGEWLVSIRDIEKEVKELEKNESMVQMSTVLTGIKDSRKKTLYGVETIMTKGFEVHAMIVSLLKESSEFESHLQNLKTRARESINRLIEASDRIHKAIHAEEQEGFNDKLKATEIFFHKVIQMADTAKAGQEELCSSVAKKLESSGEKQKKKKIVDEMVRIYTASIHTGVDNTFEDDTELRNRLLDVVDDTVKKDLTALTEFLIEKTPEVKKKKNGSEQLVAWVVTHWSETNNDIQKNLNQLKTNVIQDMKREQRYVNEQHAKDMAEAKRNRAAMQANWKECDRSLLRRDNEEVTSKLEQDIKLSDRVKVSVLPVDRKNTQVSPLVVVYLISTIMCPEKDFLFVMKETMKSVVSYLDDPAIDVLIFFDKTYQQLENYQRQAVSVLVEMHPMFKSGRISTHFQFIGRDEPVQSRVFMAFEVLIAYQKGAEQIIFFRNYTHRLSAHESSVMRKIHSDPNRLYMNLIRDHPDHFSETGSILMEQLALRVPIPPKIQEYFKEIARNVQGSMAPNWYDAWKLCDPKNLFTRESFRAVSTAFFYFVDAYPTRVIYYTDPPEGEWIPKNVAPNGMSLKPLRDRWEVAPGSDDYMVKFIFPDQERERGQQVFRAPSDFTGPVANRRDGEAARRAASSSGDPFQPVYRQGPQANYDGMDTDIPELSIDSEEDAEKLRTIVPEQGFLGGQSQLGSITSQFGGQFLIFVGMQGAGKTKLMVYILLNQMLNPVIPFRDRYTDVFVLYAGTDSSEWARVVPGKGFKNQRLFTFEAGDFSEDGKKPKKGAPKQQAYGALMEKLDQITESLKKRNHVYTDSLKKKYPHMGIEELRKLVPRSLVILDDVPTIQASGRQDDALFSKVVSIRKEGVDIWYGTQAWVSTMAGNLRILTDGVVLFAKNSGKTLRAVYREVVQTSIMSFASEDAFMQKFYSALGVEEKELVANDFNAEIDGYLPETNTRLFKALLLFRQPRAKADGQKVSRVFVMQAPNNVDEWYPKSPIDVHAIMTQSKSKMLTPSPEVVPVVKNAAPENTQTVMATYTGQKVMVKDPELQSKITKFLEKVSNPDSQDVALVPSNEATPPKNDTDDADRMDWDPTDPNELLKRQQILMQQMKEARELLVERLKNPQIPPQNPQQAFVDSTQGEEETEEDAPPSVGDIQGGQGAQSHGAQGARSDGSAWSQYAWYNPVMNPGHPVPEDIRKLLPSRTQVNALRWAKASNPGDLTVQNVMEKLGMSNLIPSATGRKALGHEYINFRLGFGAKTTGTRSTPEEWNEVFTKRGVGGPVASYPTVQPEGAIQPFVPENTNEHTQPPCPPQPCDNGAAASRAVAPITQNFLLQSGQGAQSVASGNTPAFSATKSPKPVPPHLLPYRL
jgi:hypothetical protein